MSDLTWAPDACTLPTVERPTRLAEFDDLFATAVRAVERPAPTRARFTLDPSAAARTADLAARESECCSFFTFTLSISGGTVTLDVTVPDRHLDVLAALTARPALAGSSPTTKP